MAVMQPGPGQGPLDAPVTRARFRDAVTAVQADHRADAAQPFSRIAGHGLRRRLESRTDPLVRRSRPGGLRNSPEDDAGCDECGPLQTTASRWQEWWWSGLRHAVPGLRDRQDPQATGHGHSRYQTSLGSGTWNCRPDHPRGQVSHRDHQLVRIRWPHVHIPGHGPTSPRCSPTTERSAASGSLSSAAIQQMAADETATTLLVARPVSCATAWLGFGPGPGVEVRWCARLDQRRRHRRLPRVVRHCPDDGLAVVVEGAGRSFSSIAAETVAQTVLLNALVETSAIKKMPKRSAVSRARAQVTSKMAKKKIKRLSAHSWPRTRRSN